ncbi:MULTISPECIES: response regulator transcription factor [unclassified Coleofasciculus]|uniref:response regulator transcription factor n=1 Tax=unclassified Coleofasciculus TaxID=2692782 RepID=UPI0018830CE3|nr:MULTISPECIES: response regulator transcription factor [unclassified Coleofasciculus]MBE9124651.1 response regulator transcription factor [Coleofasciculus sp. LEGE 07081]MBE9146978.1 response regulator transcription factor [Coleofasciculus sp. LEGE 07092]
MKKILVVDDDRTLRIALTCALENMGYQVEQVSSGVEALETCLKNPPDLVVSDVMMPEMDGLEFCRRLRATPSGQLMPFIFLSGKGELEDRIHGHSIGADDYLTKPVDPRELAAKIETQLERTRRIHALIIQLMQLNSSSTVAELAIPTSLTMSESAGVSAANPEEAATPTPLPLTPAEERVFWEVIQGLTNKQISNRLFISPRTVQTHLSSILNKLKLPNRAQLIRFAYENGYQSPNEG